MSHEKRKLPTSDQILRWNNSARDKRRFDQSHVQFQEDGDKLIQRRAPRTRVFYDLYY